MYNDPSGEFAFLVPVFAWIASKAVAIMTGALIGALIGGGVYAIQAYISGNWSWGGFAKSFFGGALLGAVSGGLGQVFSAGGFWATVGNGALAGAGSGGINALLNGQNFLEGLTKGAVIGGAIGAVTYTINYIFNAKTEYLSEADLDLSGVEYSTPNPSSDPSTLNNRINTFRKNNYSPSEIKKYGIATEKVSTKSIHRTRLDFLKTNKEL